MPMNRSILAAAAAILFCGCSTYREVPRAELSASSSLEKVRVATLDGFEYRFDRISVVPDTLIGFYEVTEERVGKKGEFYYEDVPRRHAIPLSRVARVELARKDPVRTAMYGASLAAAGYFLATLVDENPHKASNRGGGGKDPIKP